LSNFHKIGNIVKKSGKIGKIINEIATASAPVSAVYIIKYLIQQPYGTTLILYGEYIKQIWRHCVRQALATAY